MVKSSRSATRVLAVLNFFIERPGTAFTFSQVIGALNLSNATGHAILISFVEAGYLCRLPDRSYVLGNALSGLIRTPTLPMTAAYREMRTLADDLDVIASALFVEDHHMIVRDRAASRSNLRFAETASGRPYSLYPWGCVFHMRRSDTEIAWMLEAVVPVLSEETKADVRLGLSFARTNGFVACVTPETIAPNGGVRSWERFTADIRLDRSYNLRFLIAPVLREASDPTFAISLFGFRQPMSGGKIFELGMRVREVCARLGTS